MRRIHVPNLLYIRGEAHQGKSTLARHFRESADIDVLFTDKLFWLWCDKYHPKETKQVRESLGRYFKQLPSALRQEWFEYLVNYVLSLTKYARPDMIIEGWLLTIMPKELKRILYHRCTLLNIKMQNYTVHIGKWQHKVVDYNYQPVIANIKKRLSHEKEKELMPLVKRQRFEDCKNCAGRSNSKGRLAALHLPADLTDKRVLEINCDTGYFSIRAAQRGATVFGVDLLEDNVHLASQIANSIYRLPKIRFYQGNAAIEDFKQVEKFDYVLLVNNLNQTPNIEQLLNNISRFLNDSGQLVIETLLPKLLSNSELTSVPVVKELQLSRGKLICPNEATLCSWVKDLHLCRKIRSVNTHSVATRLVYHFTRQECVNPEHINLPVQPAYLENTVENSFDSIADEYRANLTQYEELAELPAVNIG